MIYTVRFLNVSSAHQLYLNFSILIFGKAEFIASFIPVFGVTSLAIEIILICWFGAQFQFCQKIIAQFRRHDHRNRHD